MRNLVAILAVCLSWTATGALAHPGHVDEAAGIVSNDGVIVLAQNRGRRAPVSAAVGWPS